MSLIFVTQKASLPVLERKARSYLGGTPSYRVEVCDSMVHGSGRIKASTNFGGDRQLGTNVDSSDFASSVLSRYPAGYYQQDLI